MPINYGISPNWLKGEDIVGAGTRGLELGQQAAMARQRQLESMQRAQEAQDEMALRAEESARRFQQEQMESAARRKMQEQELAMKSVQTANEARESAFKFQQQQLASQELSKLGPDATVEDYARIWAKYPHGVPQTGGAYGANLRALQPPLMPMELAGAQPGTSYVTRTGNIVTTPQVKPPPAPKPTPQQAQLLAVLKTRLAAIDRALEKATLEDDEDAINKLNRRLKSALQEQDELFRKYPALSGETPLETGGTEEQVGEPVATSGKVIRYDDQGNRL